MGNKTSSQIGTHEVLDLQTNSENVNQSQPYFKKERIQPNCEIQKFEREHEKPIIQPLLGYGVQPSHPQSLDGNQQCRPSLSSNQNDEKYGKHLRGFHGSHGFWSLQPD